MKGAGKGRRNQKSQVLVIFSLLCRISGRQVIRKSLACQTVAGAGQELILRRYKRVQGPNTWKTSSNEGSKAGDSVLWHNKKEHASLPLPLNVAQGWTRMGWEPSTERWRRRGDWWQYCTRWKQLKKNYDLHWKNYCWIVPRWVKLIKLEANQIISFSFFVFTHRSVMLV